MAQTRTFTATLFTIGFWLLLLSLLASVFNDYLTRRDTPNQHLQAQSSVSQITLARNRQGHYLAPGHINDLAVEFLIDTGATEVSIPQAIARRAGLVAGRRVWVTTASGVVDVYQTELPSIRVAGLELQHIRAHINPHMPSDVVLLGMSFLKQVDMTQRDGMLMLQIPSKAP